MVASFTIRCGCSASNLFSSTIAIRVKADARSLIASHKFDEDSGVSDVLPLDAEVFNAGFVLAVVAAKESGPETFVFVRDFPRDELLAFGTLKGFWISRTDKDFAFMVE